MYKNFEDYILSKGYSKNTMLTYAAAARKFLDFVGSEDIELMKSMYLDFFEDIPPAAVCLRKVAIRQWLQYRFEYTAKQFKKEFPKITTSMQPLKPLAKETIRDMESIIHNLENFELRDQIVVGLLYKCRFSLEFIRSLSVSQIHLIKDIETRKKCIRMSKDKLNSDPLIYKDRKSDNKPHFSRVAMWKHIKHVFGYTPIDFRRYGDYLRDKEINENKKHVPLSRAI